MNTVRAGPILRGLRQITAVQLAADGSDRQLLERFVGRRDEAAFAALVRRHGPMVFGVCRRVLRDTHTAEDALQATFLILAQKADCLRRPDGLGPWLHGVAARVALKARAREARRQTVERQAADRRPTTIGAEDPVWRDLRPLLDEAVGGLPERLRVPFVLHYLEGRTVTAVARHLGCPRGTVATHLARARQRLRARLARRGLALSTAALGVLLSRETATGGLAPALPMALARAAARLAVGQAAAGTVPARISTLAQGGLETMWPSKRILSAVVLLLGLGAVGGTVLLAQPTVPSPPDRVPTAPSHQPANGETDLSLFRQGSRRFFAEDYPAAGRYFERLIERFPDSPLVPQAEQVAGAARDMSTLHEEASGPLAREKNARKTIEAVLAGARAAEKSRERSTSRHADRIQEPANEFLRGFNALFKQGRYAAAETYAARARELDPESAVVAAAYQMARAQHLAQQRSPASGPGSSPGAGPSDAATFPPDLKKSISRTAKANAEKEIEQALQRPVRLSFKDTPLEEVLDELGTNFGLNVVLDRPALKEEAISPKSPVTLHVARMSLGSALKLLLQTVRLAYCIRDGVLLVTTPAVCRGQLVVRTYAVKDLVGGESRDEQALVRLIARTIAPQTWAEVGGSGTIDYYAAGQSLVISQTADVQEQVADILAALRDLKRKQP